MPCDFPAGTLHRCSPSIAPGLGSPSRRRANALEPLSHRQELKEGQEPSGRGRDAPFTSGAFNRRHSQPLCVWTSPLQEPSKPFAAFPAETFLCLPLQFPEGCPGPGRGGQPHSPILGSLWGLGDAISQESAPAAGKLHHLPPKKRGFPSRVKRKLLCQADPSTFHGCSRGIYPSQLFLL